MRLGYIESETTEERRKAINYYNRSFYGNEVEGRSTIVTGEVAEAVDAALTCPAESLYPG
jgi:hypothetical protein